MNVKVKDLSPAQKTALEGLLGRAIAEDEAISVQATGGAAAPAWLQDSWSSAKRLGVDQLSPEEIDDEIREARKARTGSAPSVGR